MNSTGQAMRALRTVVQGKAMMMGLLAFVLASALGLSGLTAQPAGAAWTTIGNFKGCFRNVFTPEVRSGMVYGDAGIDCSGVAGVRGVKVNTTLQRYNYSTGSFDHYASGTSGWVSSNWTTAQGPYATYKPGRYRTTARFFVNINGVIYDSGTTVTYAVSIG